MLVEQLPPGVVVPLLDRLQDAIAEVLDAVEALGHARVVDALLALHRRVLVGQHLARVALGTGVIDVGVGDEVGDVAAAGAELPHLHLAALGDLQDREPAVGGHVLVLLADPFLQDLELDVAGLLGQRLQRHVVAPVVVERVEQPDDVTARRPEPRPGREVGHRRHLEGVLDAVLAQRLARQRVAELADVVDHLALRVVQDQFLPRPRAG